MRKHFLILAFLFSTGAHSIVNRTVTFYDTGDAQTMAEFEKEAIVAFNRRCLDVWCEGYFFYEFQKLSCSEGRETMNCTFTITIFDPNERRDREDERIHTLICSFKDWPKISLPATGAEIDKYFKQKDVFWDFEDTCITELYSQYDSALKGKDGVVLQLPLKK